MRTTIKPRTSELRNLADGNGELSFWAPDGGGYIRLERYGRPGTLGLQICEGGAFSGNTLEATNEEQLRKVVRKWTRDYVKMYREL